MLSFHFWRKPCAAQAPVQKQMPSKLPGVAWTCQHAQMSDPHRLSCQAHHQIHPHKMIRHSLMVHTASILGQVVLGFETETRRNSASTPSSLAIADWFTQCV